MEMRRLVLPAALGLLLAGAPSAMATSYYATPEDGVHDYTSGPCDIGHPCLITVALDANHAKAFDDVTLLPGTYALHSTLVVPQEVILHGQADQARPLVTLTDPSSSAAMDVPAGTVLRHLEISGSVGVTTLMLRDSTLEDSIVHAVRPATSAVTAVDGSALRTSVVRMDGTDVEGLVGLRGGVELRNVTVSGVPDSGNAVVARCPSPTAGLGTNVGGDVAIIDTIAVAGKRDALLADGSSSSCVNGYIPKVSAFASSFNPQKVEALAGGTYTDNGSNVGPAVLATDAIHELATSPTIDAGKVDALSPIDIDGGPRIVGSAVDIGADEFVPPPPPAATTPPAGTPATTFTSPVAPVLLPVKPIPPGLSGLSVTGTKTNSKVPPVVHFTVDLAQRIPFKVSALLAGRIRKGKCISPAGKTGKRCRSARQFFSGTITASRGENSVGLLTDNSSQLPPGLYRLTMSPFGKSRKSTEFRVLKAR